MLLFKFLVNYVTNEVMIATLNNLAVETASLDNIDANFPLRRLKVFLYLALKRISFLWLPSELKPSPMWGLWMLVRSVTHFWMEVQWYRMKIGGGGTCLRAIRCTKNVTGCPAIRVWLLQTKTALLPLSWFNPILSCLWRSSVLSLC